jgi:IclR family acetate operon transcriptional repressor
MGNQQPKRRETGSALQKAVAVLEAVVDSPRTLSLSDLADQTGLSRQSAHRVVRQLEENGLLLHEPLGERYLVGQRLKRLSLSALAAAQRTGASHQILEDLVDQIGESCNIGVLDGRDVVYLDRVECDWPLRLQLQSGSRLPAHASAIGKLLLAYLPSKTRNRLITGAPLSVYTPHTITDPARLEAALRAVREEEVAVNDQEYTLGLLGIAVPIRDSRRRVVAALAFHAPTARVDEDRARVHIPALRAAAERLGRSLEANGADGEAGEP